MNVMIVNGVGNKIDDMGSLSFFKYIDDKKIVPVRKINRTLPMKLIE